MKPLTQNPLDPNAESQKDVSFFNYPTPINSTELWTIPNKTLTDQILANRQIEGTLYKIGKRTKAWISRHYIISGEHLAYLKSSKSKEIKKVMLLSYVRYQIINPPKANPNSRRGFKFTKFGSSYELFAPKNDHLQNSKHIHAQFDKVLRTKCVNFNFHDLFMMKKMIGKGSFGRVYLAENRITKECFAVKSFSKDTISQQKRGKDSIFNEISVMRSLEHKHILRLHWVYESTNSVYLVLDLLEGGELFSRLNAKGNYSEYECMTVFRRIFEAVSYMHKKGFMHRDLKPDNILLATKGDELDIRVADFGLSIAINSNDYIHRRCGTPGYCAPEILNDKDIDPMYDERSDIFSVGCILYQLITGSPPFRSDVYKELLQLNRRGEADFSNPKLSKASPEALDLLKKCLMKDPTARISAAEALNHAFFTKLNKPSELISGATIDFEPFNITHFSINRLKKSNLASNDSMKGFFQQPSNIIRGLTDTVQDELSLGHSFDLGHIHPASPQRSSVFKRDESVAGQNKSKIIGEFGKSNGGPLSPRSIHNSSHMQKAAIMNNATKEGSPRSGFAKDKDKEKKHHASGFSDMVHFGGVSDIAQANQQQEVGITEEDRQEFEEVNDIDEILRDLDKSSVARNSVLGLTSLKNASMTVTQRTKLSVIAQ